VKYRIQLVIDVVGPSDDWNRVAERARNWLLGQRLGGRFHIYDVEIDAAKEDSDE